MNDERRWSVPSSAVSFSSLSSSLARSTSTHAHTLCCFSTTAHLQTCSQLEKAQTAASESVAAEFDQNNAHVINAEIEVNTWTMDHPSWKWLNSFCANVPCLCEHSHNNNNNNNNSKPCVNVKRFRRANQEEKGQGSPLPRLQLAKF